MDANTNDWAGADYLRSLMGLPPRTAAEKAAVEAEIAADDARAVAYRAARLADATAQAAERARVEASLADMAARWSR